MNSQNFQKNNQFFNFENIFQRRIKKFLFYYLTLFKAPNFLGKTINDGKNKFRSGLTFLLSENKKEGIAIAAAAELTWAGIIILDDIGDFSEIRRGSLAAWKKYGLLKASHAALLSFQIAEHILMENKLDELIDLLRKNTSETILAQIEQADFDFSIQSNKVLNNYLRKTSLGRWAIDAVINENKSLPEKEKSILRVFNQLVGVAAQIKNDLDDFKKNRGYESYLKDIQSKIINYPLSLFFEKALKNDKQYLIKKYWGRNNLNEKEVVELLEKYKAISDSEERTEILLEEALKILNLIKDKKFKKIFSNWVKSF